MPASLWPRNPPAGPTQLKPDLVVLGYCLVQQCALGVARVESLGLEVADINTVRIHSILQASPQPVYATKTVPKGCLDLGHDRLAQALTGVQTAEAIREAR